jgi:glycosyltransferase involved in cell wall biosynthesis
VKLLVVSHACAIPVNQQLYASLRAATGWDVSIVAPSNWRNEYGDVYGDERWPAFDGELIPVPVRLPDNIILHTYRTSFAKLIRRVDPDVVYVHQEPYAASAAQVYFGNRWAGGRAAPRPIGFYSAQNIAKRYPPPFRWTESWVLRASRFAFPVSATVAEVFHRKGFQGRSTVLPLSIDPDVYRPAPDAHVARGELLGDAPSDTPLLGYLGRLVPEKGLATLLRAVGLLGEVPWRLALVGAGPMEAELRALAAALGVAGRVTFVGSVPHVRAPRLLSAFDALVLPSETQPNWKEQFGRVVLEAMACGTPVVGSDSGEIPVLIGDTGGGITFCERDPADLATALRRLVTDPDLRDRLATAGRAAIADRYTVASVACAFAEAITAAAGDRVKPGEPDVATDRAHLHPKSLDRP